MPHPEPFLTMPLTLKVILQLYQLPTHEEPYTTAATTTNNSKDIEFIMCPMPTTNQLYFTQRENITEVYLHKPITSHCLHGIMHCTMSHPHIPIPPTLSFLVILGVVVLLCNICYCSCSFLNRGEKKNT